MTTALSADRTFPGTGDGIAGGRAWSAAVGAVRVRFGEGRLADLGELAAGFEPRHVLVITDPGVAAAGHLERALGALENADLTVSVFDRVEKNPGSRLIRAGVDFAAGLKASHPQKAPIDLLVALGGGSALDTSKGINFLLTNGGAMEDYWGYGKATRPMLPSIGVPTTAGTGSEAQSYALISQDRSHKKMACGDEKARFRAVILDPALLSTLPRSVVAASGMDAISHAVESFVSTRSNPISRLLAREAWHLLEGAFEQSLTDPEDHSARGAMLLGAHLAGAAIEQSMLGAAHAAANPLTAELGIEHGVAVSLMLPSVVRFNGDKAGKLYRELAGGDGGGEEIARRLEALRRAGDLPSSLGEAGITGASPAAGIRLAQLATREWTGGFNPRAVSAEDYEELYAAIL